MKLLFPIHRPVSNQKRLYKSRNSVKFNIFKVSTSIHLNSMVRVSPSRPLIVVVTFCFQVFVFVIIFLCHVCLCSSVLVVPVYFYGVLVGVMIMLFSVLLYVVKPFTF